MLSAETRGLVRRGWQVSVLTSAWGAPAGVRDEAGVRVVRVRAWHGFEEKAGVPFPVFSPVLLLRAWREVRRADVVHVHDPLYLSSWVAAFLSRLLRTPYVVHRHVGFVHHDSLVVRLVQSVVLGSMARLVLAGADAIVPIDEFIASGTRDGVAHPERVHVLENGVDTTLYRPGDDAERTRLRAGLGLPQDLPLLLFVGRFVPKKGFAQVAAAAGDGWRIVFVGGDRPAGVDDERLLFLGSRPADEVALAYRCADAFVVASVGECPLTVLEALSSGLPVLVNDDPALHSPWTSGPGVRFVDIAGGGLPTAVADLLAPGAENAESRALMGIQGREFVATAFSWEAHLDGLEEVYDSCGVHPAD